MSIQAMVLVSASLVEVIVKEPASRVDTHARTALGGGSQYFSMWVVAATPSSGR